MIQTYLGADYSPVASVHTGADGAALIVLVHNTALLSVGNIRVRVTHYFCNSVLNLFAPPASLLDRHIWWKKTRTLHHQWLPKRLQKRSLPIKSDLLLLWISSRGLQLKN